MALIIKKGFLDNLPVDCKDPYFLFLAKKNKAINKRIT